MSSIKVSIIGAGGAVFALGLVKDLCLTQGLGGSMVSFMDINEERLDVIYRLAQRYAQDLGADLTFERTMNREETLQDADFIVNVATISHNEYLMRRKRELTDKLGYYYGHTGMPEYHNLQLMLDIARDIARICPDAWLLQAGNPVFEGTTLMARETGINVCGLCHGHYGYHTIARTIGLDPDKVTWQAPGLNHNIWLTHFFYENENAYPILEDWIANKAEDYWAKMDQDGKTVPAQMSRAAIHQFKMFGLMPVGDTPRSGGWWYHTDPETRIRWYGGTGGGDTPAGRDLILKGKEEKYEQMKKAALDPSVRPIDLFGNTMTREQHVPIINGLVNNVEGQFQVNIPNEGALAGLPDDVAVEVPAIVNIKGIQPIRVAPLPNKIMFDQIYPDWLDMERMLEALLTGDMAALLYGVLQSHQTRSYDQALETMQALMDIEPSEPMAYVEDIHDHYHWPEGWRKFA